MKPKTQALLQRFIRDGIEHALINTDIELSINDGRRLANEIDDRIWLYIDEYFTFEEDN